MTNKGRTGDPRTVGTGFLISDPTPDGKPRTVLVTANHVFKKMPGPIATIGFRVENADGSWRYDPEPLKIRDGAHELWIHHPNRDVAVIAIEAPPAFAKASVNETQDAQGWRQAMENAFKNYMLTIPHRIEMGTYGPKAREKAPKDRFAVLNKKPA